MPPSSNSPPSSHRQPGRKRAKPSVTCAAKTIAEVRGQAALCTRCPLYRLGTQTVFGEGPAPAGLMLVGEQPGDQEDRQGRPFVGPAGRILAKALAAVGMDRSQIYITNAVKHFKNVPRGVRDLTHPAGVPVWVDPSEAHSGRDRQLQMVARSRAQTRAPEDRNRLGR